MRKFLLTLIVTMTCVDLFGQQRTISGYVRDQGNGESLIGATVYDKRQGKGTVTNNYGFYSISTPYDSINLTYSFVGYDPQRVNIKLVRDTTIVVLLRSGKVLEEVVVTGTRAEPLNESTRMGSVTVPTAQIKAIPAFMGETDVLKAMQLLPGVSGGVEGSSNLIIRGGNPEQTLILMDGATIYNPTHLYGFFSSFNPDAVNNIELIKGGFPARYGGRLSGVADITLKEGNMNKFSGEGSLGLIASRFVVEGPIKRNKTSFIVSGRRGYINLMKNQIEKRLGGDGLTEAYYFYDFNVKVNHRFNERNRIYGSFYAGKDFSEATRSYMSADSTPEHKFRIYNSTLRDRMSWRNTIASLRWNHEFSNKLFLNLSAIYSQYDLNILNAAEYHYELYPDASIFDYVYSYKYTSKVRDIGLKVDFDYIPNTNHYIRFGGAVTQHRFIPGVGARSSNTPGFETETNDFETNPREANVYVEDDFSITKTTKINFGLHAAAFKANTKTYFGAQPRFSIRQSLTADLSLKASYAYMQQFLHMVTNAGLGMPTDLWVPSTDNVKPQSSHQVSFGAAQIVNKTIEVSIEAYYKTMNNLVEYKDGATYLDSDDSWDQKIEQGRGKAYGAELFIQKKTGRLTGWAGYTLSWNKRQFDNINNGAWFWYRYDHRHDIKITGSYKLNDHVDISSTYIYTTGNAVSLGLDVIPVGYQINAPGFLYYYGQAFESRNNLRMPAYHRVDLSVSYSFRKLNTDHKFTAAIYNAYNRKNPFYIQVDYPYPDMRPTVRTRSLFPFLPAISYSIKF